MGGDGPVLVRWDPSLHRRQRTIVGDGHEALVVGVDRLAEGVRHVRIDLGDRRAGGGDGGRQVVGYESQGVAAVVVSGAHLAQDHVDRNRARREQVRQ